MTTLQEMLYPYQKNAVAEIVEKKRILLADQPGLGKTLEVLASLQSSGLLDPVAGHAVIVLTPLVNARSAWLASIERFLMPDHPDLVAVDLSSGSAEKKSKALKQAIDADGPLIVVANHDALAVTKGGKPRVPELAEIYWSAIVIDESHLVLPIVTPGKSTNFWKGLAQLKVHSSKDVLRIAVSGTPDRGKPEYRYGTWRFLNADMVHARQWDWLNENFNVYERKVARNRTIKQIGAIKQPARWVELDRKMVIRRTKQEVLPELPPKTYHFIELPMELPQYHAYKWAESQALADFDEVPNALLTFAIEARQIAAYYEDEDGNASSNKLDWILQWLTERGYTEDLGINPGKVVISSQFVKTLRWLQAKLSEHGIAAALLTGELSSQARANVQQRFQDPNDPLRVVLLSGNMGVGIDLDVADDLIMVDLPYDPDKLEQIEDRVHRASNMHKVTIWHLLSKASIDMAIAEKSTQRRLETRRLLDGSRGVDFSRKVVQYVTGETEVSDDIYQAS